MYADSDICYNVQTQNDAYDNAGCGQLSNPLNGFVSLTGTTLGQRAFYSCEPGFLVVGNSTRTCQISGNWSNTEPRCEDDGLFPFGVSVGDLVVPPADDGSSPPITKMDNVLCPFFGVQEEVLYVSYLYYDTLITPSLHLHS